MSLTTPVAERFLYGKLTGDAALVAALGSASRITRAAVPDPDNLPAVVFQQQSALALPAINAVRVAGELVYSVKVIAKGATIAGTVETAANRLYAVLHRASGSATGGTVLQSIVESEFAYQEVDDGITYQHLGVRVRLLTQTS